MGLSLLNIGKKIFGAAQAVERQVNPFDNGATAANPNPPPRPAPAPAPAPQQPVAFANMRPPGMPKAPPPIMPNNSSSFSLPNLTSGKIATQRQGQQAATDALPEGQTSIALDNAANGIVHGFSNIVTSPLNLARGVVSQATGDPATAVKDYQLAHDEAANNLIAGTGKVAANTIKGTIVLPAKTLYQEEVEHNQAAGNKTQMSIAPSIVQGVGGAAAVPAYFAAGPLAGTTVDPRTGQRVPNTAQAQKNLGVLGIKPGESGLNRGLTVGGEALNSTLPLALSGLSSALDPGEYLTNMYYKNALDSAVSRGLPAGEGASLSDIQNAGGRPPIQQALEEAHNSGNPQQVKQLLDSIPANDPYKAPMTSVFKGDLEAADAASKTTVEAKATATAEQLSNVPSPSKVTVKNAPQGTIAAKPVPPPQTGIAQIDSALKNVSDNLSKTGTRSGNVADLLEQTNGATSAGARIANQLRKALTDNLTPAENKAVNDFLDGNPTDALTPRAFKVANAIDTVNEQAHSVRSTIDPSIGNVDTYSTRIPSKSVGATVSDPNRSVMGKVKSLADVTNLDSTFSKARGLDKFTSKDGAQIGSAKDMGLQDIGGGKYQAQDGTVFTRSHATKEELTNAGFGQYEQGASVHSIYHSDTSALKARAETVQELVNNPNAHGLFTKEQVDSGLAPKNVHEVAVSDLKDANGNPLYGSPKDATLLNRTLGYRSSTPLPLKVLDAAEGVVTQAIVLNPVFHGMNQLYQTGIAAGNLPGMGTGWLRVAKGVLTASEDDMRAVQEAGAGGSDYDAHMEGLVSKVTGGASKINAKAMAGIELRLRAGLYKASLEDGMTSAEAAHNINTFLGDTTPMNETIRRATLFAHYFKTMTKAGATQIAHPIENIGANVNTAALAGITAAVAYGYQKLTGNKNASVRYPGEIGLGKELIQSGMDLAKGEGLQGAGVVTNRINPVIKEGAQQLFHTDLYSGQDISGNRVGHATSSLLAPVATGQKITSGKKSGAEIALSELGLSTPHAKGNVAAPNLPALNTKGATVAPGVDPTGYQQQQAYFDTTREAKKTLSPADQKIYDQTTAATSKLDDKQIQAHYSTLFSNPKVLNAIVAQKQAEAKSSGTPLDPLYGNDITPEQRAEYLHMQSLPYKGDDYVQQQGANGDWMQKLTAARNAYFNTVNFSGASPSERVQSPQFDTQTQADLTTAGTLTGSDKSQFITAHPNVSAAYDAIAKYTNDRRVAQGNAPFKLYPNADPATQAALNTYQSLPKGNGSQGGSPDRAAWIKANPDAYAKMQDYLTSVSEYELANSAGSDKYQGATPSQAELKSASSLGKYDIASIPGVGGAPPIYSLNPTLAYAQNNASSSNSNSNSYNATYAAQRKSNNETKHLGNAGKFMVKASSGKFHVAKSKVSFKKAPGSKHSSIKAVTSKKAKLSLKSV